MEVYSSSICPRKVRDADMDPPEKIFRLCHELNMHNFLAKSKGFGIETLYSHSINTAMIANRIFDFVSNYCELTEKDRSRLLLASALHDIGKMNIELGKEKHKLGATAFVQFLSEKIREKTEIIDDILQDVNKEDFERLFWISQTHHKSTSLEESLLEITDKDLILRDILIISDRISSMTKPDAYIKYNDLPLWDSIQPKFFFHKVKRIRGVLTQKLHLAVEDIMTMESCCPIAYFPEGTLYISSSYPQNPRKKIRNEIMSIITNDIYRKSVIKETFVRLSNPKQKVNIFGMAEIIDPSQGWRVIQAAEEYIVGEYSQLKDKEDYELAKLWLSKLLQKVLPAGKKGTDFLMNHFGSQDTEAIVEKLFSKEEIPTVALTRTIGDLTKALRESATKIQEGDIIGETVELLMDDFQLSFETPQKRIYPLDSSKGKCAFCSNPGTLRAVKTVFGEGSKKFSHFELSSRLENAAACPVCYVEYLYRQFALNLPPDTQLLYVYPQRLYTREFYESTDNVLNELLVWMTASDEVIDLEELEELTRKLSFSSLTHIDKGPIELLRRKSLSKITSPNFIIIFVNGGEVERFFSKRKHKSDVERNLGLLFVCSLLAKITYCKVSSSESQEGFIYVPPYVVELSEEREKALVNVENVVAALNTLNQIRFLCEYNTVISPIKILDYHPRIAFTQFLSRYAQQKKGTLLYPDKLLRLIEVMKTIEVLPSMRKVTIMSRYEELDSLGEFLSEKFYELRVIEGGKSRYVYTKPMTLLRKHILKNGKSGIHTFIGELTRMAMEKRVKHEEIMNTTKEIKTNLENLAEELGEDKFKDLIELLNKSFLYYGVKKVREKKEAS